MTLHGIFCCLFFELNPGCDEIEPGVVLEIAVAQAYALLGMKKFLDTVALSFEFKQGNLHQMRASTLKI